VKARQQEMRRVASNGNPKRFNQARRPKYLFSGLTKCAECGGGYVMYWRDRLACFGARSRGTCTNRLTISRQEVEERVLVALREKLMRRDLFEDFCREYVRELNRLRMEHRVGLSSARTELATVERESRKLVQAIKDGVSALSIKDELLSLEARKAELQSRLDAPDMPELLHPRMADVYREKVRSLCHALESEESRTGAVEAIRALIESIVLEPDGDQLKITLKGDLAGMLSAARDTKRSPDTGDLMVQIKLVAGAGFEPVSGRLAKWLMARHFWRKALRHQHFGDGIESAAVCSSMPRSALVLETFWRRIANGMLPHRADEGARIGCEFRAANHCGSRRRGRFHHPDTSPAGWTMDANALATRRTPKGTIFAMVYPYLVPRLGHAQAIGAIAHRLCRLIWKILHQGIRYEERGPAVSARRRRCGHAT
jgi:Recombinase zinc beta ribbon domain